MTNHPPSPKLTKEPNLQYTYIKQNLPLRGPLPNGRKIPQQ